MFQALQDLFFALPPAIQQAEEPLRDNFWNVPESAKIALYVAMAMASLALFYGLYRRMSLYLQGTPLNRLDHLPVRIGRLFVYVLGQLRIARQTYGGFMHIFLFWSFLVLFLGTTLATVDADFMEPFGVRLLRSDFYLFYEFTLDIFGVLFLIALGMGWYRRYVVGSVKLSYDWGWAFALGSLFLINLTGFFIEGIRIAVDQPAWQLFSPVGWLFGQGFLAMGLTEGVMRGTHLFFWVFHFGLVGIFIAGIPYTPLMHILTSPLNIILSRVEPTPVLERTLQPIPNIESLESWGVGKLSDFSWKQLLDFDACTECGRCQVACPAWNAGTALNPKHLILDLRNQMLAEGGLPYSQIGGFDEGYAHVDVGQPLVGGVVRDDTLWACTTCRACVYECPVFIEHVDSIVDMRRHLVMTEARMPDSVSLGLRNLEKYGNPWGYSQEDRMKWAAGLDVPVLEADGETEYLYWVGCAASFDDRNQRIARSVVQILQRAGVDFAVLGQHESCNGDPARRLGNEYLFQTMAAGNIETLNSRKFKKIITACPHCFNTIGNEYIPFGGNYEVIHHTQLMDDLIRSGRIRPTVQVNEQVTYHDPCYLGRYNDVYDAPREVLASIPGIQITEMPRSREKSMCCGGGGGGMWVEVPAEKRINEIRLKEAQGTGAETVAAACPFCIFMFDLGGKVIEGGENLGLKDVSELLLQSLGPAIPSDGNGHDSTAVALEAGIPAPPADESRL